MDLLDISGSNINISLSLSLLTMHLLGFECPGGKRRDVDGEDAQAGGPGAFITIEREGERERREESGRGIERREEG